MCGIVGIISSSLTSKQLATVLLRALSMILNRGFDSIGIGLLDPQREKLVIHKRVNTIEATGNGNALEELRTALHDSIKHSTPDKKAQVDIRVMMAHSRWRTTGDLSDRNAHPHADTLGRFAIIHNGIIENYQQIREKLKNNTSPVAFASETDSEVIVHLISSVYDKYYLNNSKKNISFQTILAEALSELKGAWALVILNIHEPKRIYFAKHGSPLVLGFQSSRDTAILCSEPNILNLFQCDHYVNFADGSIFYCEIEDDGSISLSTPAKEKPVNLINMNRNVEKSNEIIDSPAPYTHWMIREIMEQPTAIRRIYDHFKNVDNCPLLFNGFHHLFLVGSGTSFHAAEVAQVFFRKLEMFETVTALDAGSDHNFLLDFPMRKKDNAGQSKYSKGEQFIFIILSQSGETKDSHLFLQNSRRFYPASRFLAVTNYEQSLIARDSDYVFPIYAGREVSVAATKSFTSQIICLSMMASASAHCKVNYVALSEKMRQILSDDEKKLCCRERCKAVAKEILDKILLAKKKSIFVLGYGVTEPYAKEGALKIKEVSYIHAEAMSTASLKHGTLALIDNNVPVIYLINDDYNASKIMNTASEVFYRGGYNIAVTNKNLNEKEGALFHQIISLSTSKNSLNDPLLSLLLIFPMQIIAYELAVLENVNADYPKNLAKTVTVL